MTAISLGGNRVKKPRPANSIISALPWIGPAILLILLVVVWPAIELIRISLTKITSAGALEGFLPAQAPLDCVRLEAHRAAKTL